MLPTTNVLKKLAPKNINLPKEIHKNNNFAFRRLTAAYRQPALDLLAKEFSMNQPLSQAIYKLQPKKRLKAYENQYKLWNLYMDECIDNNMSVIIVDLQKNQQVIGVSMVKDFCLEKPEYEREILVSDNVMLPTDQILRNMVKKIDISNNHVFESWGSVADVWGVAIKQEHTRKGLFKHIIASCCSLAIEEGYQHVFSFCTNIKTATSFKNMGFSKMGETNIKDFRFDGVKIFRQVQSMHECTQIWFKSLG